MFRRIILLIGALALVLGAALVPAISASAYTCDNSPGATQDDGLCGYVNPADKTDAKVIELQYKVDDLQRKLDSTYTGEIVSASMIALGVIFGGGAILFRRKNERRLNDGEKGSNELESESHGF